MSNYHVILTIFINNNFYEFKNILKVLKISLKLKTIAAQITIGYFLICQ
jgi:hypothetical protein